jgi:hypothetical protein
MIPRYGFPDDSTSSARHVGSGHHPSRTDLYLSRRHRYHPRRKRMGEPFRHRFRLRQGLGVRLFSPPFFPFPSSPTSRSLI